MPWLKIDTNTPGKEEIAFIAERLKMKDSDLAFAKIFRLWAWFDQYTTNGHAAMMTIKKLDEVCKCRGLCKAAIDAGWLEEMQPTGMRVINFERHSGSTTKARHLNAIRQERHRKLPPKTLKLGIG